VNAAPVADNEIERELLQAARTLLAIGRPVTTRRGRA
jgi:hypothetical protein